MKPNRKDLPALYGKITGNTWARSHEFLGRYIVPKELLNSFKYAGKPVPSITMHKDMIAPFTHAMQLVVERGLEKTITEYNGCFAIRNVRGGSSISNHAYALAIDLNASTNPLGKKGNMDARLVACFEESGFTWGGRWKRLDFMHFEWVNE